MRRSWSPRGRGRIVAALLAVGAIGLVVIEPFPKGATLLALTEHHGVDAGDLPSIILLLVAVWLALLKDRVRTSTQLPLARHRRKR
jgi:hypothetical protein